MNRTLIGEGGRELEGNMEQIEHLPSETALVSCVIAF